MKVFGDRDVFALAVAALGGGPEEADASAAATWAEIQLWVRGQNFTEHVVTSAQRVETGLAWPAIYLARWFARSWDDLFHRHRWPVARVRNARAVCAELNGRVADAIDSEDEVAEAELIAVRDRYVATHALAAGAAGGLVPDVYFGRDGDRMSIATGPSHSHPSTWFQYGGEEHDVPAVAFLDAVRGFVRWVRDQLDPAAMPATATDAASLDGWLQHLDSAAAAEQSLAGYVGVALDVLRAERVADDLQLPPDWMAHGSAFNPATSAAAIVFRALTPTLGVEDVRAVLGALASVPAAPTASASLAAYGARTRPPSELRDWAQGYDAAVALRRLVGNPDRRFEIEAWLTEMGIAVRDLVIDDPEIDGASAWDDEHGPVVFVNPKSESAATGWGRRMVIAHELCHLLIDRPQASPLRVVSGPWAPPLLERRANAFAAELLLPRVGVARVCGELYALPSDKRRQELMDEFGVGTTTLYEHLQNRFRLPRSY